eukprot:7170865-Pyramimonas_sp.AAC.1
MPILGGTAGAAARLGEEQADSAGAAEPPHLACPRPPVAPDRMGRPPVPPAGTPSPGVGGAP